MLLQRFLFLFLGFTVISFGAYLGISVQYIGLEPWSAAVFGISKFSLTYGIWNILIQSVFLVLTYLMEKRLPRLGTIINSFYVSFLIDLFVYLDFAPKFENHFINFAIFLFSVFICAIGASMVISTDLGGGAKTQFYVAASTYFSINIMFSKNIMETLGLTIALIIGGPIFIGTFVFILVSGYVVKIFIPIFQRYPFNQQSLPVQATT